MTNTQTAPTPDHRCLYARLYLHKRSRSLMVSCPICYTSLACIGPNDTWAGSAIEARIASDQFKWEQLNAAE